MEYKFDIERSIANWRAFLSQQSSFSSDDLDELEAHLREEIVFFRAQGMEEEEAFRLARQDLGHLDQLDSGFERVRSDKAWGSGNRRHHLASRFALVGNYLAVIWRNARREWTFSTLNIAGLSIGLASCLVIGLFVHLNLSFDRFHPGADDIYRVVTQLSRTSQIVAFAPQHLEKRVRAEYADVREATPVRGDQDVSVRVGNELFLIENVLVSDTTFFDMFGFRLLLGDADQTLVTPDDIVLTRSTAMRLFSRLDVLGERLQLSADRSLLITGIVEDPPEQSYLQFDALRPFNVRSNSFSFYGLASEVYLRFDSPEKAVRFEEWLNDQAAIEAPQFTEGGYNTRLQPLTEINFRSDIVNQIRPTSDARYFLLFSLIGLVILAMAGFNHVNLTSARASSRNREIGVRKVLGATPLQLKTQFMGESVLVSFLALPISLAITAGSLPTLSRFIDQPLSINNIWSPAVLVSLIGLVLLLGVAGGIYPAFLQSRLSTSLALRGAHGQISRARFRIVLVGIQMSASIALIAFSLIAGGQIEFIRTQNLGFDQSHVVMMPYVFSGDGEYDAFRQQAERSLFIDGMAIGPALGTETRSLSTRRKIGPDSVETRLSSVPVGTGLIELMGIPMLEGYTFSEDRPSDLETGVILSRSLAEAMGEQEATIGSRFDLFGSDRNVIGIAADIRQQPFNVEPELIAYTFSNYREVLSVVARLKEGRLEEGLTALETAWGSIQSDRIFSYEFLDQRIQQQYAAEARLTRLFRLFTGLSIVVACLGMVGLAAFSARRRRKEIGIRKVMGAPVRTIVFLLSREFVLVVLLSSLVAIPAAFIMGRKWLDNFSQRIELSPTVMLLSLMLGLAMVVISTVTQSWKAAVIDPVDTLRHD